MCVCVFGFCACLRDVREYYEYIFAFFSIGEKSKKYTTLHLLDTHCRWEENKRGVYTYIVMLFIPAPLKVRVSYSLALQ